MVKSLKGQFIFSLLVAVGFVVSSFSYTELTAGDRYYVTRWLMYFAMIVSVFNAGILTQKYMASRKT
ncbi:hypothetical protein [Lentibacillus salinarum]|uniref:Uncharacterized protein n=1 Tax=Lentibacillus salinarum TaxID=446820 RepID=A0ABW3ZSM6_9BACI